MYICYLYYFVSLKIIVAHIHICSSLFINMNVSMFINGDLNTLLLDTPYLGVIYHILASFGGVHTPLNSPSRWGGIYLCGIVVFVLVLFTSSVSTVNLCVLKPSHSTLL